MASIKKRVPSTPNPATAPASGPGNPDPLAVNLPAAQVRTSHQPGPRPPDLRLPHEHDQSAVDTTSDAIDQIGRASCRERV